MFEIVEGFCQKYLWRVLKGDKDCLNVINSFLCKDVFGKKGISEQDIYFYVCIKG